MHRRPHSVLLALVFGLLIALPSPAHAQKPDREAVYRELIEAMRAHVQHRRFDHAFSAASAALAIKQERETLCSAGMIASRLDRFPECAELLSECVRLTTDHTEDEEEIQKRLIHASTLEMARARVGTLHIVAPSLATITVNHKRIGLAPIDQPVFVPPNTSIEILADNFDGVGSERVTIAPGQSKKVVIRTHRREKSPVSQPVMLTSPPPSQPLPKLVPDRTPFWISFGLTSAAATATFNFALFSALDLSNADKHFQAARQEYAQPCRNKVIPNCNEFIASFNRGIILRDLAVMSGIGTGIGIAVSAALWKFAPIKPAPQGIGIAF